jgi:phenylalanyl-tRNA synthetase beta chain
MRQDMVHSGLEAIQYNRNRRQQDLRFFEFGKTYRRNEKGFAESRHLSLFLSGNTHDESWYAKAREMDFYFLKSFVENVVALCGIDPKKLVENAINHPLFTSGISYSIGERLLVSFGILKRSYLRKFDITSVTCYADFNWDAIVKSAKKKPVTMVEIPKYPQVRRDLSMLIDESVEFGLIEQTAFKTERKLLRGVQLFDVYQGDKIESGKKSYAVSFLLQDDQQTLTDQQIDKTMERLMAALSKEVGAIIRSS